MKKILLVLLTAPFIGLNAQIFINTNPNTTSTESTIVKENKKVDETKTELETTKTNVEEVKTTITSPNIKINTTGTTTTGYPNTNKYPTTTTSTPIRTTATSSTSNTDVPPNAIPGKCYARCQTEDQYRFTTKQVVSTPKMIKKIQLPALYTSVYDTIVVRPRSVRYENVPAQYETISEQKMTAPSTTKWIKGKADAGCLSADPNDCQVMCLVEVPAQYTTVTKRVLKQQAYKREITVPMDYKIISKQVKTQNARYMEQVIPATYKTVQERVLVSKGGYQGWREVLCGTDLTTSKISQIQTALKAAGYNPGPIDNVFGAQTKEALKAYQRAKGLPVGNLNMETLKALGVN